ncbi:hypothetical protein UFOVP843_7 [uncultured Caudovirales phage]|uniref:Uncharacterized protein n=1 Tax=uncultured Caudovirales phage TaxID=2100421 RepID=A0A6J5PTS7_9CAUD|nr:hypothetical protein UFOVP843_7 [uncultured Caudovirales phage]CAB4172458.1 hypothetical protein UFOVP936_24 [uncultured Caudovirales phage]
MTDTAVAPLVTRLIARPFEGIDPNLLDDAELIGAVMWAQGVVNRSAWPTDDDGWFNLATANAILAEQAERSRPAS